MKINKYLMFVVIALSLLFRSLGLNWDQSHHLHPDERFLTMVTTEVKIPKDIINYFSQKESTLNPYNHGFNFYVYGTFPLLITRLFGEVLNKTGYDQIFLIGRQLSIFFDLLTLILVYKITFQIFKKQRICLWAMFFYAISLFPIQQAHFFTVDSFTVFFSTLTIYFFLKFLEKKTFLYILLAGSSFGLTLANKTSIGITLPVFLSGIFFSNLILKKSFNLTKFSCQKILWSIVFILGLIISFRIFQPYAFDSLLTLSGHWLENIKEAHKMITGEIDYPPNIQWAYTKPLIHPILNIFLWGLGPLISILSLLGIVYSLNKPKKDVLIKILILLAFCLLIFVYQGIQLAKYMRYFYPLYPLFCLFAGFSAFKIINRFPKFFFLLILLSLIQPLSFISIYTKSHSRVLASEWIYKNIPEGAKITSEEWDDGLPLGIPGFYKNYQNISLAPYNPESREKWQKITNQLKETDYIIMSSNRLFDSIPRLPQRYPVTGFYYKLLFEEKLGFSKVAEISSYPCFPPIGKPLFCLNDQKAEESFTVYDHPQIFIFKKENFSDRKLEPLLDERLIQKAEYLNPRETNRIF